MVRRFAVIDTTADDQGMGSQPGLVARHADPGAGNVVFQLERQLRHTAFVLHDGPVQSLSAAGAMLQRACEEDDSQAVQSRIAAAEGLIEHAAFEIRQIMCELRPAALDAKDLAETIGDYVQRFQATCRVPIEFLSAGPRGFLPDDARIVVLRIVQEALTNARRHAFAENILVVLDFRADYVSCSVTDDGAGFDPSAPSGLGDTRHWGLASMRENAELVGGTLDVSSAPGRGTAVTVVIPFATSWT